MKMALCQYDSMVVSDFKSSDHDVIDVIAGYVKDDPSIWSIELIGSEVLIEDNRHLKEFIRWTDLEDQIKVIAIRGRAFLERPAILDLTETGKILLRSKKPIIMILPISYPDQITEELKVRIHEYSYKIRFLMDLYISEDNGEKLITSVSTLMAEPRYIFSRMHEYDNAIEHVPSINRRFTWAGGSYDRKTDWQ